MVVGTQFFVLVAICGTLCGLIGFLPLLFSLGQKKILQYMGVLPLGILSAGFSLILMLSALLVCYKLAPDALPVFGIFAIAAFLVAIGVYAFWYIKRLDK